jgi:hypothetical protein
VAVTWKEGKKNKDGEVAKKNFIATCGTTLDGKSHEKKRWEVHTDGKLTHRTVDVKRLRIVDQLTSTWTEGRRSTCTTTGGRCRQGSLALESRRTTR